MFRASPNTQKLIALFISVGEMVAKLTMRSRKSDNRRGPLPGECQALRAGGLIIALSVAPG